MFTRELKSCKSKMDSQSKQVAEYSSRLDEYDKKFEENSRKFGTLLTVWWLLCDIVFYGNETAVVVKNFSRRRMKNLRICGSPQIANPQMATLVEGPQI